MRRRDLLTILGGAAATWPLAATAQQPQQPDRMRRIGVLMGVAESSREGQARIEAFRRGLQELGWTEGRNIRIEGRWAAGDRDRIRTYAAELVALAPDAILANGTPAVDELRRATDSIPIVFAQINDPVGLGYVASATHPGGNITGVTSTLDLNLVGKWLEMLKEIAPSVTRAALLFNPDTTPYYISYLHSLETAPPTIAVELTGMAVRGAAEVEQAIGELAREPGGSLIIPLDSFNVVHFELIVRLAERFRLPAVSAYRQFVLDGGLMSYGFDTADIFWRSASYVDHILKGANPADLPVQAPTKFGAAINLKTAATLGLTVPPSLLARADEVIE